ncbi:Nucleoside-diphosphate-sugar epimerase [Microbacterium esteraromaticum]|uniref:Nucleoside-diphosphate-sugar epimerase n=1 Tax=Microbacterium esteraromaticum TaxID=57043 RepID=A0A1R4IUB0_9MICO|nr:NAD(P)-dependent oxidoreductase [Microbacterium esteraromaticum]SJN23466.1 Nucleoside-diphosphate-sugar epimerase [Microbacterium esteraromaticum]
MPAADSRVLVTGATGFLGGAVLENLAAHGHEAFASGRNAELLTRRSDSAHSVRGDLRSLAAARLEVDAVIHCAALSTPWGRWREFQAANIDGTRAVIDFVRRNGVRRLVHVSSPSIYAAPRHRLDISEDDVDEQNRLNGYIRSKIAAERMLQRAHAAGDIPELVIIRPRGLIGVGDPSLMPRMLEVHDRIGVPLLGGGQHPIDVTAVENVAHALRLALTEGDPDGGVYNITNGEPRAFRELLTGLLTRMGITPRLRPLNRRMGWMLASALEGACTALPWHPEPPLTRYTFTTIAYAQTLDISRARTELGYAPEVSLDEALDRVAAHLSEERRARVDQGRAA